MPQQIPHDIRQDPYIRGLFERIPEKHHASFSDVQLVCLKEAMGARTWGIHQVDMRGVFGFWHWRYYYVVLAGRNKRQLSDRERALALHVKVVALALFILFSTLLGLVVLYLIKSAMGIDIFPNYSLGLWGWFSTEVLHR